jgi:hypothetical protein
MTTKLKPIPKKHIPQANFMRAIVEMGKKEGVKTFTRAYLLKEYSRNMKKFDPTHDPKDFGFHIKNIMDHIAVEQNGQYIPIPKGNARIEI